MFIIKNTEITLSKEEYKTIFELFSKLDELDIKYEDFWACVPCPFSDNDNGYMTFMI